MIQLECILEKWVELNFLSREGEIAIAKRIEAGKDVMINALTQSPIVGKKIFEWKEQIENQELLVRDIIDIDSTYEDFEALDDDDDLKINKKTKKTKKKKINNKKEEESHQVMMMNLMFHLLKWKKRLNQKY